jgi:hypothetical protein
LVYNANDNITEKFLEKTSHIDLHFLYYEEHVPDTLINQSYKLGIISFLVECGNHLNENAINTAWNEVINVLNYCSMIDNVVCVNKYKIKKYETIGIIKTGDNFRFLIDDINTETFMPKDTVFSYDDKNGEQKTFDDCFVFMPSKVVKVSDNDAGFLCKLKK